MSEKDDARHECVLCNAKHESKEALREHFRRRHADNEIDNCGRVKPVVSSADCARDACEKIFESSADTTKYRSKARPDLSELRRSYRGKQLPLEIRTDERMSHEGEDAPTRRQKCRECDFVCRDRAALRFHVRSAHLERAKDEGSGGSARLDSSRKTSPSLDGRRANLSPRSEMEHKCVLCDAELESKEALRQHFRKHANNEIDKNGRAETTTTIEPKAECECDVCDELFASITETIRHRFKMHPDSPKFYCSFCGKQFPLKIHRDKHTATTHDPRRADAEPHKKCDECNVIFYNEKALGFHLRSVHKRIVRMLQPIPTPPPSNKIKVNSMNDALSVYYCHLCGVEYVVKFNLQQHLERVHTQAERDAVPEDLIKCTVCSALFCSKRAYETHNSYHKPNDLYVTSEQQRLRTVTKVDQDFDIRRVAAEKFTPRANRCKRRMPPQQRRREENKRTRETLEVKVELDFPYFDREAYDCANRSSDSESDIPLDRRIPSS